MLILCLSHCRRCGLVSGSHIDDSVLVKRAWPVRLSYSRGVEAPVLIGSVKKVCLLWDCFGKGGVSPRRRSPSTLPMCFRNGDVAFIAYS